MVWHTQSCFFQDEFPTDIAGSSEAETLVSGKAEYSISIREDKNVSFLE